MSRILAPFALASLLLLSACATGPATIAKRLQAIPTEQHAYVLGTYAITCVRSTPECDQQFNAISAYFRDTTDGSSSDRFSFVKGSFLVPDTKADFVDRELGEKGYYFCIPLPPDDYEIFTYDFFNFAGGGNGYSVPTDNHFSLPFKLAPGEAVHIGRVKVTSRDGKNILGMLVPAPGFMMVSAESVEAERAALQKCPEPIGTDSYRRSPLSDGPVNAWPFVQVRSW